MSEEGSMPPEPMASRPGESELPASAAPEVRVYQLGHLMGVYRLTGAGLTVGKTTANDLVIVSPLVSRHHARISGEAGCWQLEDLGSTNGTFVYEGERLLYSSLVQRDAWILGDGQEIRLGPHPDTWRLVFSDPTSTDKSRPIYIDEEHRRVWVRSVSLTLPRDHYVVLLALYRQAPHACPYEDLCSALDEDRLARKRPAYSALVASEIDSLHHLIHRLRARIEVDPKHPRLILQEPHVGYRLQNQADPEERAGSGPRR